MKKYIFINAVSAVLFAIAISLSTYKFHYLSYAVGIMIFFFPGINLALAIEQIALQKISKTAVFLSSVFFSLVLNPILIYYIAIIRDGVLNPKQILIVFAGGWLLFFLLFLFLQIWRKVVPTDIFVLPKDKIFYIVLVFFLSATSIHFFLYPFIPEADPYSYLIQIDQTVKNHLINIGGSRTLFAVLIYEVNSITQISNYWLFKIILPLSHFAIIIIFYILSRGIKNNILRVVASLAPLYLPVFYLEMLIPRPQSVFLIVLPIVLFVSTEIMKRKGEQSSIGHIYWLMLFFMLSVIGVKIHEFFIFVLIFVLYALFVYLKKYLIKYPLESFIVLLILTLGIYPWLNNLGIAQLLQYYISPFVDIIKNPKIDFWFIDNYINVDGNKMGWSGYSWILYYLYSIGVFIPCFILIYFKMSRFKKFVENKKKGYFSLYLLSILLFLLIAEIFPRLGLAFLPDRAWLFVSLSFLFFAPFVIKNYEKFFTKKQVFLLVLSAVMSLGLSWTITYAKQGWTTKDEFRAMDYIKNNTAPNSLILSQATNSPGISYFADRKFVYPEKKFTQTAEYLDIVDTTRKSSISFLSESLTNEKEQIAKRMQDNVEKIVSNKEEKEGGNLADEISAQSKKIEEINFKLKEIEKNYNPNSDQPPVYFLYSRNKFDTLYSMRSWWKDINLFDTNIEKFNKNFATIYSQDGVYIWRIK